MGIKQAERNEDPNCVQLRAAADSLVKRAQATRSPQLTRHERHEER
jgi:hypothetical protein